MLVRRIARPLLSTIFIAGGIDALRNPAERAVKASPLIDKSFESLPGAVTEKVPADPDTLVKINAVIQIGGGVLLASGKAPRIASLALAGSLVPTTLAGHDFWNEADPSVRAIQRTNFIKNLSLLGGLMIASVDTEGKPSLGWRGRRAVKKAQASISAALPSVGAQTDHASDRVEHALSAASERGSELAETAKAHGSEWLGLAKERGTEFAELAVEKGNEWAESASEQTEVLGKRARKRAAAALEKARAKKDELTH